MFSHLKSVSSASNAYVSHGTLPQYVDPEQPPSKKNPFSAILNQGFSHTVQLILPQELYDVIWQHVEANISKIQFSRVIMSLSDLLEGEFFNKYIKIGNILMLSEGRPGADDRYSLKDGILRLELAKDKYERCGLVGEPIRDAGRKHMKTRFAVEVNLRLPSMLHGKKGFERVVWACKNVLNHAVTWLFHDFDFASHEAQNPPITKHHPLTNEISPRQKISPRIRVPDLKFPQPSESDDDFENWAVEIYEWFSLVAIESPRICWGDAIDPFLSRYQVPDNESKRNSTLITLTWTGFIPAPWVRQLFVTLLNAKISNQNFEDLPFLALSAYGFKTSVADEKNAYTILWSPNKTVNIDEAVATTSDTTKSLNPKADEKHGEEFVLWETNGG